MRLYDRRRVEVAKGSATEGESLEIQAAYQTTAMYLMVQRRHTEFADDFVAVSPDGNTPKIVAFVTREVADRICESLFHPGEWGIPTPGIGASAFDQFTFYCRVAREELGDIIGREVDGTTARNGRVMLCAKIVFQLLGVAERMPEFASAMVSTVFSEPLNEQRVDYIARAAVCDGVPDIPNRTQAGLRFHYEAIERDLETEGLLKLDQAELYSYLHVLGWYLSVQANRPDFARTLITHTESPEPVQWLGKHEFGYAEVASRLTCSGA